MPTLSMVNIIFHALAAAPAVIDDVETIARDNWNEGLVADAKQGLQALNRLFNDLVGGSSGVTGLGAPMVSATVISGSATAPGGHSVVGGGVSAGGVVSAGDIPVQC